jgi:hypothetical protein
MYGSGMIYAKRNKDGEKIWYVVCRDGAFDNEIQREMPDKEHNES